MAQYNAFDGTTYIRHGKDHAISENPTETPQTGSSSQPATLAAAPAEQNTDLSKRLEALEDEFATFKKLVEKRLKSIEKHQDKYLSPEERVYSIQEDS